MLKLILGHGKSGKSSYIYSRLAENSSRGERSYLIVPEQQTVQCEQALLSLLPDSAQLNTEALNFSRLANLVFRHYGGLSYNYADKGCKTLIMWKNLRDLAPLLQEYGNAASGKNSLSFSSEMLSAISEMKAYCVSPQKLENVAQKLEGNEILKRKLMDISLIYSAYNGTLSERYSDAADDLSKLAEKLSKHGFFKGAKVYIDSFSSFTKQEYEVIKQIMLSADELTVALTLDSVASTNIHYVSTADTATRLLSMARGLSVKYDITTVSASEKGDPIMSAIHTDFWKPYVKGISEDPKDRIRLISAKDPYEEAEAAATEIKRLMRMGMRCREISIVCADASSYRGIIDAALEKEEIPYFFSQPTDILSKPLIKFIISALRIKLHNWRTSDIMTFLRSGLCGFDSELIDLFECYCSVWRLSGASRFADVFTMNPDGYSGYMTKNGENILKKVNILRKDLVSTLEPLFARFDMAENAAYICRAIYLFMEKANISEKLSERAEEEYAKGRRREASELIQLYNATVKALENISLALGDEKCSVGEFSDALTVMLSNVSVNAIPTAKDQVTVGSASMLRADGIKCAILMGLNEGEFPGNVKESGLLSNIDKKLLESHDIQLSPDTSIKSADELFYVYRAMSLPTEKLILLYHETNLSGKTTIPSTAVERIKSLFPSLKKIKYSSLDPKERILSPGLAIDKLTADKESPLGIAFREYALSVPTLIDQIRLAEIPIHNRHCSMPPDTSPAPLHLTQSIMDDYMSCPFEYMCKRILKLKEVSPAFFTFNDFGTYIHYVFEQYLRHAINDGVIGNPPDPKYISKVIGESAEEYVLRCFSGGEASSERLKYRFARMRRLAEFVAFSITKEFADSSFRPEFLELSVASHRSEPSLAPLIIPTSLGKDLSLSGKIDRVDIWRESDENIFVRVIDYKSGKKTFSMNDIDDGVNLQLPLYLFALCDSDQTAFARLIGAKKDLIPAGAMYLSSLIPSIDISNETNITEKAEEAISRSGFIVSDPHVLGAMSHSMTAGYLCGAKSSKNGEIAGKSLVSGEDMQSLKSKLINTVTGIGENIISGRMDCAPSTSDGVTRCDRCPMRQICRSASIFLKQ